jgi:hypothetical protein
MTRRTVRPQYLTDNGRFAVCVIIALAVAAVIGWRL